MNFEPHKHYCTNKLKIILLFNTKYINLVNYG